MYVTYSHMIWNNYNNNTHDIITEREVGGEKERGSKYSKMLKIDKSEERILWKSIVLFLHFFL